MKQKIICVEVNDGNFELLDIEFESHNVIMLSLGSN
jgi:hypothetical protein